MDLLFFTEARLLYGKDKKHYSPDQSFSYLMFKRYLKEFRKVYVVARTTAMQSEIFGQVEPVEGKRVIVLRLPFYLGPYQYAMKKNKLEASIKQHLLSHPRAAVICRVPGTIGSLASKYMKKCNRLFGVEVVGDPKDVFAPGALKHPLRRIFKQTAVKNLKRTIGNASASLYVTDNSLQKNYPSASGTFSTHASNVMLPMEAFAESPKKLNLQSPLVIIAVGTLSAMYKSPDVLIEAIAILKKNGSKVRAKWIGDGRYLSTMTAYAKRFGVEDKIAFPGAVKSSIEVRKYLDDADLFVLPSRQEGLPRAMIEAMARGLPCVGTKVGGIPELLDSAALVPVNNADQLAEKITCFASSPNFYDSQAERNLREAYKYKIELLEVRRNEFYQYLKRIT